MILHFVYSQGAKTFTDDYDVSSIKFSVLKYTLTIQLVIEIMIANNYKDKLYLGTVLVKDIYQFNKKLTKNRAINILNNIVDVGHIPELTKYDYFANGTYEVLLSQEVYL